MLLAFRLLVWTWERENLQQSFYLDSTPVSCFHSKRKASLDWTSQTGLDSLVIACVLAKRLPAISRFLTFLSAGETETECCSHSNFRPLNLVFMFPESSENRWSLSKIWVLVFQLVASRASSRLGCGVTDSYYSNELNQNYRLDYRACWSSSDYHNFLCLTYYYIFHHFDRIATKPIFEENLDLKGQVASLDCSPRKFDSHTHRLLCACCSEMRQIRWDHSPGTWLGIRFRDPPTQTVSYFLALPSIAPL